MQWHRGAFESCPVLAMKTIVRRVAMAGMSLIDYLVVMAIVAILMVIAVPSMTAYKRSAELTSAANRLLAGLQTARGEAMKRGTRAMLVPALGRADWSGGWVVFLDLGGDHLPMADGSGIVAVSGPLPEHLRLSGSNIASGSRPYVMFDASGYSRTKSGAFGALAFTLSRTDVPESALDQIRKVIISSTGRSRVCKPANLRDQDCTDSNVW